MMTSLSTSSVDHVDDDKISRLLLDCPTILLRNGMRHPSIGYGTYKVGYIPPSASSAVEATAGGSGQQQQQRTAEECVYDALTIGYRFLECAQFYGNEKEVGKAIQKSGIPRSELFLCSKVWTTTIEKGPEAVRAQLDQTLADLQTDYIDLYLIHWPVPIHHTTAYKTLISLKNEGKIKGIGVSNYAIEDYYELKNDPHISDDDLPLVNQIEINPFLYRSNTISLFQKDNVVLQSYRSLRDGKVMDHPTLVQIGQKYSKTVPQILGRWCIQHNFIYVPKSIQYHRMIENANVFDFIIDDNDMNILDQLTTREALETFQSLYRKCVNRDTTKDGTMDNVKMDVTID